MAGMKVQVVEVDKDGNIDLAHLRNLVRAGRSRLFPPDGGLATPQNNSVIPCGSLRSENVPTGCYRRGYLTRLALRTFREKSWNVILSWEALFLEPGQH